MCTISMPSISTTGAGTFLGLDLLATQKTTMATYVTESADDFILLILHRAVTTVMSFLATNQTGDYPIH